MKIYNLFHIVVTKQYFAKRLRNIQVISMRHARTNNLPTR